MPYRCDFEADEPPEHPDRVIDGEPFLYHPTAGPDGPGGAAAAFDPAGLPRDRAGDAGRLVDWLRDTAGVRAVRVEFDGGNDEGFARFGAALTDGGELSAADLVERGVSDGTAAAIQADRGRPGELWGPAEHLREHLDLWLAEELCTRYFYEGWGNGPFQLFGAFEADLATGRFTDLREVERPEEIWVSPLPPRFPPGDRPPPPPAPRPWWRRWFRAGPGE